MIYTPLIESCRKAIFEGRCLGCTALENPLFIGRIDCEYSKIKKNEGEQLKWSIGQ